MSKAYNMEKAMEKGRLAWLKVKSTRKRYPKTYEPRVLQTSWAGEVGGQYNRPSKPFVAFETGIPWDKLPTVDTIVARCTNAGQIVRRREGRTVVVRPGKDARIVSVVGDTTIDLSTILAALGQQARR